MQACNRVHRGGAETSRDSVASFRPGRAGFTLIEILIVIGIIALLTSLVVPGVLRSQLEAQEKAALGEVVALVTALENYEFDEGIFPGEELPRHADRNDFPLLYGALFGRRQPHGPGGRSAPYMRLQEARVAVRDSQSGDLRRATRQEREDDKVSKYLLDPWNNPYVYRAVGQRVLVYSCGPDGVDDTGSGEAGDDIRAD